MTTILTNARLVTEDGVVDGTLVYGPEGIVEVQPGRSGVPGAEDAEGDLVAPGLIECHTDNLERHFVPRPGVFWPNALAAALAHDAQVTASGITTVYDAICAGGYDDGKDYRTKIMAAMIGAVEAGGDKKIFRAEHRLHLRCETTDPNMMAHLEAHAGTRTLAPRLADGPHAGPAPMAQCRPSTGNSSPGEGRSDDGGRRRSWPPRSIAGATTAPRQLRPGFGLLPRARHPAREP